MLMSETNLVQSRWNYVDLNQNYWILDRYNCPYHDYDQHDKWPMMNNHEMFVFQDDLSLWAMMMMCMVMDSVETMTMIMADHF